MSRRNFFQYILGVWAYLNLPFKPSKLKKMPVKVTYIGIPKIAMASSIHSVKEFFYNLPKVNISNQNQNLRHTVLSVNTKLYSSKMHSNKKMLKTEVIYKDSSAFAKSMKMWRRRNPSLDDFIKYTIVDVSYGVMVQFDRFTFEAFIKRYNFFDHPLKKKNESVTIVFENSEFYRREKIRKLK